MATIPEALASALAYHQAGRLQEAEQIYRQVLALEPQNPHAWRLLGVVANQAGRPDVAIQCLENALKVSPEYSEAHCALGTAFQAIGRRDEALACFRRAIEIKPSSSEAHYNLGHALQAMGKREEAIDCYRRAVAFNPVFADAHNNLGLLLHEKRNLIEAAACFQRALELQPELAEPHNNLGLVLRDQGQTVEAAAHFRRALQLDSNYVDAASNLGLALQDLGQLDEAAACYKRAIELNANYVDAYWNQSLLLLLRGDFERGWTEYEWRWQHKKAVSRRFTQPRWDGRPLEGKTILLYAEQGFGDTIQFIRYAPMVKSLGATVVVECQKRLAKLLASAPGIDQLITEGQEYPDFDFHAPLLSLPGVFKTVLATIPATVPYLFADPALIAYWREKLSQFSGFRIGINWHGRVGDPQSARRDIPLENFLPLAQLPGVRLISLQKSPPSNMSHASCLPAEIIDLGPDVDQTRGAFVDTAAIMMNLDLVITSDTSVPHLAGALGVPVWVALPSIPEWRWLLDRSDSPWYPTMRLFRQPTAGDWTTVFVEMQSTLSHKLNLKP
jgi:Tfp pilus assembly protein PilF